MRITVHGAAGASAAGGARHRRCGLRCPIATRVWRGWPRLRERLVESHRRVQTTHIAASACAWPAAIHLQSGHFAESETWKYEASPTPISVRPRAQQHARYAAGAGGGPRRRYRVGFARRAVGGGTGRATLLVAGRVRRLRDFTSASRPSRSGTGGLRGHRAVLPGGMLQRRAATGSNLRPVRWSRMPQGILGLEDYVGPGLTPRAAARRNRGSASGRDEGLRWKPLRREPTVPRAATAFRRSRS